MKVHNVSPTMNNNPQKKNPNFKGFASKASDFFALDRRGPMTRQLFITNAFVFLLGSRLYKSRDKNEVRETATRDIPTIVIAVMGVPVIGKWIAKSMQKKTGFAVMDEGAKNVIPYSQSENIYRYNDKLSSGLKGFSERLAKLGGNLKKIYSSLGDEIQEKLKGFSSDNKQFIEELGQDKELLGTIKEALKAGDNKALKRASFIITTTKMAGFALTLATVGILIPKMNILITEVLNRNKANETDNKPEVKTTDAKQPEKLASNPEESTNKSKVAFKDFLNK